MASVLSLTLFGSAGSGAGQRPWHCVHPGECWLALQWPLVENALPAATWTCSLSPVTWPQNRKYIIAHTSKQSIPSHPCLIWNLLTVLGHHYRHSCYSRKQLILGDFSLSWGLGESWLQQVFWGYNSMQNSFMLNLEVSSVKAGMLMESQEESLG